MLSNLLSFLDPGISVTGEIARRCGIFVGQMEQWKELVRLEKGNGHQQIKRHLMSLPMCSAAIWLVQFWNRDPKGTIGAKYVGGYDDGDRHGYGTYTFADGRSEKCLYENGEEMHCS